MIRSLLLGPTVLAAVLLGRPVGAQDAFGVVGTWEMTGIENAPVAETVVFARMTFTGDRLPLLVTDAVAPVFRATSTSRSLAAAIPDCRPHCTSHGMAEA